MSKKSNILIIGNYARHPSTEAFLRKFLKIMVCLNNNIYLFSGDCPNYFRESVHWYDTHNLCTCSKKASLSFKSYSFMLRELSLLRTFHTLLKHAQIDKIIILGSSPLGAIYFKLKQKKIILYRGGKPYRLTSNLFLKFVSKLLFEYLPYWIADKIVIEGNDSLHFQNLEPFNNKIVVIPLFIEAHLFTYDVPFYQRKNYIGFFSSLTRTKGISELLLSIPIIMRDYADLEFLIGGEGPLQKAVDTMAMRYTNISFLGWIQHEVLSIYLNKLKLLVLPTRSEGLPNIMLESMACGTPVLITSVGATSNVIRSNKNGFILENTLPATIAKGIIHALNNPDLQAISVNARDTAREFTFERAVKRYKQLFDSMN